MKKTIITTLIILSLILTGCTTDELTTAINQSNATFNLADGGTVNTTSDATIIIYGQSLDGTVYPVEIEPVTGALRIISNEEAEIHEEHSYSVCNVTDLGNAEVMDILIVTPDSADEAHLLWDIEHESEASLRVYQDVTVTDNGTELASFNRVLSSSNTAGTKIYVGPTVTDLGTLICEAQSGSGRAIGGTERASNERVLKTNAYYLLRITNETALNNVISTLIEWYEHTPGG